MSLQPPKIDPRTYRQLVEYSEQLARRYTSDAWQPAASGQLDAGGALMRIFARLVELLLERVNQAPQKNLLAFLDLVGTTALPPQPARVALKFFLAAGGAGDALVPALTQVAAAPLPGDPGPILFETERELVVTRSELAASFVRDPATDRFGGDHTPIATGLAEGAFPAFAGDTPMPHYLYLSHRPFFGDPRPKTAQLTMSVPVGTSVNWLQALTWAAWDGTTWHNLQQPDQLGNRLSFLNLPSVAERTLGGTNGAWLRASLQTSLPRPALPANSDPNAPTLNQSAQPADALRSALLDSDGQPTDVASLPTDRPFAPFGPDGSRDLLLLAFDQALTKPDVQISLTLTLAADTPVEPGAGLQVEWAVSSGPKSWQILGTASPSSDGSSDTGFSDTSLAFTQSGVVTLPVARALASQAGAENRRWLRARLSANTDQPHYLQAPRLQHLTVGYQWRLPQILNVQASIQVREQDLAPETGFANQTQLDLTKAILPFGEKPKFNDALFLANRSAFAGETSVTLDITLSNPRSQQEGWPIPPVRPSASLRIAWEYWDASSRQWTTLLTGAPLPAELLLDPPPLVIDDPELTLSGRRARKTRLQITERLTAERNLATIPATALDWQATIKEVGTGPHAILVAPADSQDIRERRWGFVFVTSEANPKLRPAALNVVTTAAKDRFNLAITTAAGLIIEVYSTEPKLLERVTADASGNANLTLQLDERQTDLLLLVRNAANVLGGTTLSAMAIGSSSSDTTYGLTRNGRVTLRLPEGAGETTVNGVSGRWLRARIANGDYGEEASYQELPPTADGAPAGFKLIPATYRPPSIQSILIDYAYLPGFESLDGLVSENDFVVRSTAVPMRSLAPLVPFVPMDDTQATLYLGFRRPGATSGFANRPTTLFCEPAEVGYDEAAADRQASAEPPVVAWEYWNGGDWNRLGMRDETQSFTRRGLLSFVGPADFPAHIDFGLAEPLFWLRARWERGTFAADPWLRRVQTNTIWASHTLTISNETLGSSTGEPGQRFVVARTPVLPGQQVIVRELELPSQAERAAIEAEEGHDALQIIPATATRPAEIWVRWHEVPDFYGSGPRSRHYTLNRLTGELAFGDGQNGLPPIQGRSNLRLARYQSGGGPLGNRAAGTITQLKTAVPFVDKVTNLDPSAGGAPAETLEAVIRRAPQALRHRDRAVAIADFEDLARLASPDVALVRGIAASRASDAGNVLLLLVPRSAARQPVPSLELLGRVRDFLLARAAPTVELLVRGPDWLEVTVHAEVAPTTPELASDVQTAIIAELHAFLHPLTGGPERSGWVFGRKPYRSDLYAVVARIPGVSHVRSLSVDERPFGGPARAERFLVFSGEHQIVMSGEIE